MPKEIRQRVAVIAGREYKLHYGIEDRDEIERELDKGAWDAMTSGRLADQVTVLRYGIRHKFPTMKDAAVRKRLQEHLDQGGSIDVVVRTAFWALIEAGLIGTVKDLDKLRKILPDPELEADGGAGDDGRAGDDDDAPGKDAAAAVSGKSGF